MYRNVNNFPDCKLLQPNIDFLQNLCLKNGTILNVDKTTIRPISFKRKTLNIAFNYKLPNNLILCFRCVRFLGVLFDCNLY
jgi:hypothetical protein